MNRGYLFFAAFSLASSALAQSTGWKAQLIEELPLLGHRNWIIIADSAYPLQIAPGIKTVATGTPQLEVLRSVLAAIAKAPHVRANVFLDSELSFVPETDAPGVKAYRADLEALLGSQKVERLPHEQLIQKLADAGATFQVYLMKTTLAIPYTTVFLQLDCRYWSAEAEARLRSAMQAPK